MNSCLLDSPAFAAVALARAAFSSRSASEAFPATVPATEAETPEPPRGVGAGMLPDTLAVFLAVAGVFAVSLPAEVVAPVVPVLFAAPAVAAVVDGVPTAALLAEGVVVEIDAGLWLIPGRETVDGAIDFMAVDRTVVLARARALGVFSPELLGVAVAGAAAVGARDDTDFVTRPLCFILLASFSDGIFSGGFEFPAAPFPFAAVMSTEAEAGDR